MQVHDLLRDRERAHRKILSHQHLLHAIGKSSYPHIAQLVDSLLRQRRSPTRIAFELARANSGLRKKRRYSEAELDAAAFLTIVGGRRGGRVVQAFFGGAGRTTVRKRVRSSGLVSSTGEVYAADIRANMDALGFKSVLCF